MTDAPNFDHVDFDAMFAALCSEVGFCLHEKGQKKVVEALSKGLDAAMKAVLDYIATKPFGDSGRVVLTCH